MSRQQPCSNLTHPRPETGEVVRETPKARYVLLICPVCGRPQGIRRVVK